MKIENEKYIERVQWKINQKMDFAFEIIEGFYNHFKGNVYVAFSGGKDSTVLLWLVRKIYPEVPAVFSNTGLAYPEIIEFVKKTENVEWIRPVKTFKKVLKEDGYPIISKMQSQYIQQYRETKSEKLKNLRLNGAIYNGNRGYKISDKWKYLVNAPFKISDKCCYYMKKQPMHDYEKETGRHSYIGIMATESSQRKKQYLQDGCNVYDSTYPSSRPLSIFTDNDIWTLIKKYNIPYSKIYDMGYKRTGCMYCLYGVHLENPNRFQVMAKTHPKQYKYAMEKLDLKEILKYIKVHYTPYNSEQLTIFDEKNNINK